MNTELEPLYKMIDALDITLMTTRRPDGHLESRAMANQKRTAGADLWFVTADGTGKLRDIDFDPHVNLGYYNNSSSEWVSVSGVARPSRDRETIKGLYAADWATWFPKEGDPRHGTSEDPRIVLIAIHVHAAVYFEVSKPQPIVMYEMAKGWLTGTMPHVGDLHAVGPR